MIENIKDVKSTVAAIVTALATLLAYFDVVLPVIPDWVPVIIGLAASVWAIVSTQTTPKE